MADGQIIFLYVLNRDSPSVSFLQHITAESTGNMANHCPPLAGAGGWKRNTKVLWEKPKAGEANNYDYNKWLQPFANNLHNRIYRRIWVVLYKELKSGRRGRAIQSTPCPHKR